MAEKPGQIEPLVDKNGLTNPIWYEWLSKVGGASGTKSFLDLGGKGDGATDDAPALRAAIAGLPNGGQLYVPATANGYLMNSAVNNAVLDINNDKAFSIIGDGWSIKSGGSYATPSGSVFKLGTAITTSIDFLHWYGSDLVSGCNFRNFAICPFDNAYGLNRGRDGISIDGTVSNDNFYLTKCIIDHCFISTNRGSIFTQATSTNNGGGAFAFCNITNNQLMNTVHILVGDGIIIEGNLIGSNAGTSGSPGIYVSQVPGGAGLFIFKNVINTFNGMIIIDAGTSPVIAFNELEMSVGFASTYGKLIDIRGGLALVTAPVIIGNSISQNSSVANYTSINIDNCSAAAVYSNRISQNNLTPPAINVTANSVGAMIGANAIYLAGTLQLNQLSFSNSSPTSNIAVQPSDPIAWPGTTPAPTATSGAFTTAGATVYEKKVGRVCNVAVRVTVTTVGTASGAILVSLPTAAVNATAGSAVNNTVNTDVCVCQVSGGQIAILPVTGVIANNIYYAQATYEVVN